MKNLYKNPNVDRGTKGRIAEFGPEETIPSGYQKVERIYLVVESNPNEADYTIPVPEMPGSMLGSEDQMLYYKFVTDEGRDAFATDPEVKKTVDPRACTNPACLIAVGLGKLVEGYNPDEQTASVLAKEPGKKDCKGC